MQSAERLPGLARRCPAVVRIGIQEHIVSPRFGGVDIVTAAYLLRDAGFTRWLDDERGILTVLP